MANTYTWYGLFSSLGVLISACAYANQGQKRFYEVRDDGLLYLVDEEAEIMQLASEKPITVIARLNKKIFLDLSPFLADHAIKIWVF